MFDLQESQASLKHHLSRDDSYQTGLSRSQERLIQSLFRLPLDWKLVPCFNKRPLGKGWQRNYCSPQIMFHFLSQQGKVWVRGKRGLNLVTPNGYSLLCGYQSQNRYLVAIDCDSVKALKKVEAMRLPDTVSYSSGRQGHKQFLYYLDRPIKSFRLTDGLEVRGRNLLSTLPPSVHPLTGKYGWINPPDRVRIPTISSLWLEHIRPKSQFNFRYIKAEFKLDTNKDIEKLVRAINPVYADIYDDWIRIGMALKDWDSNLLGLWDDWSRNSSKYRPGECNYRWSTFNGSGITFRTVYYYAAKK